MKYFLSRLRNIVCDFRFWVNLSIAIILSSKYIWNVVLQTNVRTIRVDLVIIGCISLIAIVMGIIAWWPTAIKAISSCLIIIYITYTIKLLSITIFDVVTDNMRLLYKLPICFALISIIMAIAYLIICGYERMINNHIVQTIVLCGFIIMFSTPFILTISRSYTLSLLFGGAIASVEHIFLKDIVPYMANIHYNHDKLSLNVRGKVLVSLLDLMFAYIGIAYGFSYYIVQHYIVTIEIGPSSKEYRKAISAYISSTQHDGKIIGVTKGYVHFWPSVANDIFYKMFILFITLELIFSIIMISGTIKNFDLLGLKRLVKTHKQDCG